MEMDMKLKGVAKTLLIKYNLPVKRWVVDCIQFVREDWGYVFVEKEPTAVSHVAVDVIAEENRMAFVTPEQEDVPAAMTKKQAGERDVQFGQWHLGQCP